MAESHMRRPPSSSACSIPSFPPSLPSGINYRGLASVGTAGIMQIAENGVLDAYLATLDVLDFLNDKDNPDTI
jgi:hypothetical protein